MKMLIFSLLLLCLSCGIKPADESDLIVQLNEKYQIQKLGLVSGRALYELTSQAITCIFSVSRYGVAITITCVPNHQPLEYKK